jgi:hypothetical protein
MDSSIDAEILTQLAIRLSKLAYLGIFDNDLKRDGCEEYSGHHLFVHMPSTSFTSFMWADKDEENINTQYNDKFFYLKIYMDELNTSYCYTGDEAGVEPCS